MLSTKVINDLRREMANLKKAKNLNVTLKVVHLPVQVKNVQSPRFQVAPDWFVSAKEGGEGRGRGGGREGAGKGRGGDAGI